MEHTLPVVRRPGAGQPLRRERLRLLDTIRGFTLVHMIAYHALWNLKNLFDVRLPWFSGFGAELWQQGICWTFLLLAGFCWPLGSRPARRGLLVLGAGCLVSAVTAAAVPQAAIRFGVLTLIGSATLVLIPLDRLLRRVPPLAGAAGAAALFALTRHAAQGFLLRPSLGLPEGLYRNGLTAYLGFPPEDFFSTDYFPLLPWLFLFLTGYFICRAMKDKPAMAALRRGLAPLDALGRHSLLVYLLHQPVLYGLCALAL